MSSSFGFLVSVLLIFLMVNGSFTNEGRQVLAESEGELLNNSPIFNNSRKTRQTTMTKSNVTIANEIIIGNGSSVHNLGILRSNVSMEKNSSMTLQRNASANYSEVLNNLKNSTEEPTQEEVITELISTTASSVFPEDETLMSRTEAILTSTVIDETVFVNWSVTPLPLTSISREESYESTTQLDFNLSKDLSEVTFDDDSNSTNLLTDFVEQTKTESTTFKLAATKIEDTELRQKLDKNSNVSLSTSNGLHNTKNNTIKNSEEDNSLSLITKINRTAGQDMSFLINSTTALPSSSTVAVVNSYSDPITNATHSNSSPGKNYDFVIYDDSNLPCTLASMNITLRISYNTGDCKTITKEMHVPNSAKASGKCGEEKSHMTLAWPSSSLINNNITFQIKKDKADFHVHNIHVGIILDDANFPNNTDKSLAENTAEDLRLFSASVENGIHICHAITEIPCGSISILIKDVSLIAYNDRQDLSYRKEEFCNTPINMHIAIIVGGILAAAATVGIIASYIWYRKITTTFRSELP